MSLLLSPFAIGNIILKNRIVVSPMCQYSSQDGFATNWHLVHLGSRATGGAALVMQEATAVSAEGRISYGDLGIWKDEHLQKLSEIVDFLHEQGALAGIQLSHAGRKASTTLPWDGGEQIAPGEPNGWQTSGPSAIAFKSGQVPPIALDAAGIKKVIEDFVQATERAVKVGYDVVELHAAHGYLLHQFLSSLSNNRTDEYGGSFENRIRLLLEVVQAVQQVWTMERTLFVRLSASDWLPGGWTIEESVELCRLLKGLGVHLVDVSSGGNALASIPAGPGYQVGFSEIIRQQAGIATAAVGLITNPQQAEDILAQEKADLIFIARESLRNPNFPHYASSVLDGQVHWPVQYQRAGKYR